MFGLAEFTHELENPVNLRLTFRITAKIRWKCNND